jgi:hypothetical protein
MVMGGDDLRQYDDEELLRHELRMHEDTTCAQIGCILSSCIPLAGCITAYLHMGAPEGSRRKQLAVMSLIIATTVWLMQALNHMDQLEAQRHGSGFPHHYQGQQIP